MTFNLSVQLTDRASLFFSFSKVSVSLTSLKDFVALAVTDFIVKRLYGGYSK